MRWVVELPATSGGTEASVTVDGESWKAALTHARGGVPIDKFRCDFDDDGTVRVQDIETRQRYVLRPLQVALSGKSQPSALLPEAASVPAQPAHPATDASSARVPSVPPAALPGIPASDATSASNSDARMPGPATRAEDTSLAVVQSGSLSSAAPEPAIATDSMASSLLAIPSVATPKPSAPLSVELNVPQPATLVFQRGCDADQAQGLTFRERVLAVPPSAGIAEAERVAREVWSSLREALRTHPPGQYISVAVFDHVFESRPEGPPLVVLSWKDWRGEVPELFFASTVGDASRSSSPIAPPSSASPLDPKSEFIEASSARIELAPLAPDLQTSAPIVPLAKPSTQQASSEPASIEPIREAAHAPDSTLTPSAQSSSVPSPSASRISPPPAAVLAATPSDPVAMAQPESAASAEPSTNSSVPSTMAVTSSVALESWRERPSALPASGNSLERGADTHPPGSSPATAPSLASAPSPAVTTNTTPASLAPNPAPEEIDRAQPASSPTSQAPVRSPQTVSTEAPAPPPSEPVQGTASSAPVRAPTPRGDELLSDAFLAVQDLAFVTEPDEACSLVATLMRELLQAPAVLVSIYDIDRDELVVRASEGVAMATGRRGALARGARGKAAITQDVVTLAAPAPEDALSAGSPPGPVLYAPAVHNQRLFGIVEVHREASGASFDHDEQHAAAYVSAQLGKFLAEHSRRVGFEGEPPRSRR